MKNLLLVIVCIPLLVSAQEESKGIQFVNGLSWEQVHAKAKRENKYIFVDVFATWCGPCKMMDSYIYPNDTVGRAMKDKFISVKMQMDTSAHDSERVRSWYATARQFSRQYTIQGYPSFLFFSPEGKLVYKDLGYKSVPEFVDLISKAEDPGSLQYAGQLENYQNGKKDFKTMAGLAVFVKNVVGNRKLADSIAIDCKKHYLDTLSDELLLTKENIDFVREFSYLIDPKDNFFRLCYYEPAKVYEVTKDSGWARDWVYNAIELELDRQLLKDKKPLTKDPDWGKIASQIKSKYENVNVKSMILDYQVDYYATVKNWEKWAYYKNEWIEKNPQSGFIGAVLILNNSAWVAFLNCNDTIILKKALTWVEKAISILGDYTNSMDTKACLLYKLGRTNDAINLEQNAIEVCVNLAVKQGKDKNVYAAPFYPVIDKMKKGEPTYLDQGAIWTTESLERIKNSHDVFK